MLEHAEPTAVERLTVFHRDRVAAVDVVTRWWSTGDTNGEVILDGPLGICDASCEVGTTEDAYGRMLAITAPIALAALASAKTRSQRQREVAAVVDRATKSCPNCKPRMMDLYMTGLRAFNARSPEML